MARENDLPLGFAVVEFDKPEQAEETFHRVQDCLIGGQTIDVKYCIPGHSVPEAFSRHLHFLVSYQFAFVSLSLYLNVRYTVGTML